MCKLENSLFRVLNIKVVHWPHSRFASNGNIFNVFKFFSSFSQGFDLALNAQQLLDSEFLDDTANYVQCNDDILRKLLVVVEELCLAFGGKINWHKSLGFWVSQNPLPTWMPSHEFKWVPKGTTTCYLGCHVGLHVNADMLVASLLLNLRRNFLLWDLVNLSFAGCVLIEPSSSSNYLVYCFYCVVC